MKSKLIFLAISSTALLALQGCKDGNATTGPDRPDPIIDPEMKSNQLDGTPSTLLNHAADARVHWQKWNPDILKKAEDSQRLIFAMIGSARYPGTFETLRAIESDPEIVRHLNGDFVPVLVDLDICRETSLIASGLSADARQSVAFPFVLLLSPSGAPVSWQPIIYSNDEAIQEMLENSIEVVGRLWEDPEYVLKDSREKTDMRQSRLPDADPSLPDQAERLEAYRPAVRRLTSFYDEDIQTLAGAGGLFPFGTLDALLVAGSHPELPESLRQRSHEVMGSLLNTVLNSAMIDPLDGGIYSSRRGASWNLPNFVRDSPTQAKCIRLLSRIHRDTGSPRAIEVAKRVADFVESQFQTSNGLFALAASPSAAPSSEWLWTTEQLREALNDEEYEVWNAFSEFNRLGNLPSEADPRRRFFRLNSLGLRHSVKDVADTLARPENEIRSTLESGRKKLLKAREDRFPSPRLDDIAAANASFHMVSAYAALYTATGNPVWRTKAEDLGKLCRKSFGSSRFLNERPGEAEEEMSDARAFTYAVAIQAMLDLAAVTLEDEWNLWAHDLCTLLGENFVTENGRLVEVRNSSRVIDLDYEDRMMIFGESTAGLTRINLTRLDALGFQTTPTLQPWLTSMPQVDEMPVIFTDSMNALAYSLAPYRLVLGPDVDSVILEKISRLPLERVARRSVSNASVSAELSEPKKESRSLTGPEELEEIFPLDR